MVRSPLLLPLVLLLLWTCSGTPKDAAPVTGPTTVAAQAPLDTAQAYAAAVAEYIQVMIGRGRFLPDTLYIGRHQDFPGIELPAIIERTPIRVIDPGEAEALKNAPHFQYLNIFSWVEGRVAEFQIVTFTQGMRHRPDGSDDLHRFLVVGPSGELAVDSVKR